MGASDALLVEVAQKIALIVLVIQTWDCLVSLRQEYNLVWKVRWTKFKVRGRCHVL